MEDFIYVLIGVAWVAYSIYNQSQKQKRKLELKSEVKKDEVFSKTERKFESILNKKFNFENLFEVEESNDDYLDSQYSELDVVEEKEAYSFNNSKTEGVSAFSTKQEVSADQVIRNETEDHAEDEKINNLIVDLLNDRDEFDMRRAVIYSEILNPPYIKI